MLNKPLVSVVMITYGHEKFIREAVEGVLMQKCNFEVELIIVDDCSPDKTETIIKEIKNCVPNSTWIKYIKHKKNKGMIPNFIFALKESRGLYIATCEGDDYWTDPSKLQKQVDFLENNKAYILSFHDAVESERKGVIYNNNGNDLSKEDLVLNSNLHTSTNLFRWNEEINKKLKFDTIVNGDTALYSILGHFGKGKYIKNISPAVYRIHEGGGWSGKKEEYKLKSAIDSYQWILNNSDIKYQNALKEKILKKSVSLAIVQSSTKKWKSSLKNFKNIVFLSIQTGKYRYIFFLLKKITRI